MLPPPVKRGLEVCHMTSSGATVKGVPLVVPLFCSTRSSSVTYSPYHMEQILCETLPLFLPLMYTHACTHTYTHTHTHTHPTPLRAYVARRAAYRPTPNLPPTCHGGASMAPAQDRQKDMTVTWLSNPYGSTKTLSYQVLYITAKNMYLF